jgi:hypothetical protein
MNAQPSSVVPASWMAERGGLARFTHEALRQLVILRPPLVDHLDRDLALEHGMLREIHRRDATDAEQRTYDVLVDRLPRAQLRAGRRLVGMMTSTQLAIRHRALG